MLNLAQSHLIKIALGVLAAVAVVGALAGYGHAMKSWGASEEREKATAAAAEKFAEDVRRVAEVGEGLSQAISAANNLEPKVVEKYRYVKQKVPLPADCRVDDERLRAITEAVGAANAARGISPVVRSSHDPEKQ